jgi:hypothetical protein
VKKSTKIDLQDLTEIMEGFVKTFDKLTQEEKIDLAARLKPVAKNCEVIDKAVKELVKVKLKHKNGEVPGEQFKAKLVLVPVDRLDQKALKEEKPDTYEEYVVSSNDERITFILR